MCNPSVPRRYLCHEAGALLMRAKLLMNRADAGRSKILNKQPAQVTEWSGLWHAWGYVMSAKNCLMSLATSL